VRSNEFKSTFPTVFNKRSLKGEQFMTPKTLTPELGERML